MYEGTQLQILPKLLILFRMSEPPKELARNPFTKMHVNISSLGECIPSAASKNLAIYSSRDLCSLCLISKRSVTYNGFTLLGTYWATNMFAKSWKMLLNCHVVLRTSGVYCPLGCLRTCSIWQCLKAIFRSNMFDLISIMCCYHHHSFLILLIIIKATVTLVLQCVYINTQFVIWKGIEKIFFTLLSLFPITTRTNTPPYLFWEKHK